MYLIAPGQIPKPLNNYWKREQTMWTFQPILKSTIWGGNSLASFKKLGSDQEKIGESWETSGIEGSESVVADGPDRGLTLSQLIDKYEASLLGKRNFEKFGNRFPLLIKFIDASQNLSVQVHPDDVVARRLGYENGKTELWYILKHARDAKIALGFNRSIEHDEFQTLVESGDIENALRFLPLEKGAAFVIPAGTVHAIGKGTMLAEIQQTSDTTFRIYDYKRKDESGKERELHIDLARQAISFGFTEGKPVSYRPVRDIPVNIARINHFTTNVMHLDTEVMRDYREFDTFVALVAFEGKATIESGGSSIRIAAGNSLLIPASAPGVTITPDGKFSCLETFIR